MEIRERYFNLLDNVKRMEEARLNESEVHSTAPLSDLLLETIIILGELLKNRSEGNDGH